jgi:hypothetical protein
VLLKPEEYEIRFETDNCEIPEEVGAWIGDRRCIGISITNFSVKKTETLNA